MKSFLWPSLFAAVLLVDCSVEAVPVRIINSIPCGALIALWIGLVMAVPYLPWVGRE
jgi:hypothetical protein